MIYISFIWKEFLIYGKELKIKKKIKIVLYELKYFYLKKIEVVYVVFKEYMN